MERFRNRLRQLRSWSFVRIFYICQGANLLTFAGESGNRETNDLRGADQDP